MDRVLPSDGFQSILRRAGSQNGFALYLIVSLLHPMGYNPERQSILRRLSEICSCLFSYKKGQSFHV
jgi:hypothetical protein